MFVPAGGMRQSVPPQLFVFSFPPLLGLCRVLAAATFPPRFLLFPPGLRLYCLGVLPSRWVIFLVLFFLFPSFFLLLCCQSFPTSTPLLEPPFSHSSAFAACLHEFPCVINHARTAFPTLPPPRVCFSPLCSSSRTPWFSLFPVPPPACSLFLVHRVFPPQSLYGLLALAVSSVFVALFFLCPLVLLVWRRSFPYRL